MATGMEERMGRWGEAAANDLIQFTVNNYRQQGIFSPDKLYVMTTEEVDSEERIGVLMHIVCAYSPSQQVARSAHYAQWTTIHERLPKDESEHIK